MLINSNLSQLPDHARVWIYQANRTLSEAEIGRAATELDSFCQQWNAHGAQLKAGFDIRYGLFIILAVDEEVNAVSGCSIDKSVVLVKALGEAFGCDFLDRKIMAYRDADGQIALQDINQFWAMRKAGIISAQSIVFNNLVNNLADFRSGWEVPFAQSWHAEMFS